MKPEKANPLAQLAATIAAMWIVAILIVLAFVVAVAVTKFTVEGADWAWREVVAAWGAMT